MAATYTVVTLDQMQDVLKASKGWKQVDCSAREFVYEWKVPQRNGVVIRVYTSIHKDTSVGRRKGGDAIRVCAVDTNRDRGLVKSRRVHRTQGWRDNLRSRVMDTLTLAKERS
jgi:hypothetical protein